MPQTEEADWPATKLSMLSYGLSHSELLPQLGPTSLVRLQLDRLLKMAEDLQEKGDYFVIRRTRFLMINFAGFIVAAMACVFAATNYSLEIQSFAAFASVLMLMFFFCLNIVLMKTMMYRMNRQEKRDRKALFSIVDMLREIEPIIAEKEELSALERAEIRIRLARLDVGPGVSR
jgi:hypothetical protein